MKKKISLFGKSIPLTLILVIAIAGTLGTATVVNHFASTTGEVEVETPVEITEDFEDVGNFYANEPVTVNATVETHGDSPVDVVERFKISSYDGDITEDAVEKIEFDYNSYSHTVDQYSTSGSDWDFLYEGDGYVVWEYRPTPDEGLEGTWDKEFTVHFADNVAGDIDFDLTFDYEREYER